MNTATSYDDPSMAPRRGTWFGQAEDWLDSKGKAAWIILMVLGFIFFWPVGLVLLIYMIWGKHMFSKSHRRGGPYGERSMRGCGYGRFADRETRSAAFNAMRPSGNTAFDAYKAETLRRLEEEQESFHAFLDRLRAAKDKAEFDQFMDDRARKAAAERNAASASSQDEL